MIGSYPSVITPDYLCAWLPSPCCELSHSVQARLAALSLFCELSPQPTEWEGPPSRTSSGLAARPAVHVAGKRLWQGGKLFA